MTKKQSNWKTWIIRRDFCYAIFSNFFVYNILNVMLYIKTYNPVGKIAKKSVCTLYFKGPSRVKKKTRNFFAKDLFRHFSREKTFANDHFWHFSREKTFANSCFCNFSRDQTFAILPKIRENAKVSSFRVGVYFWQHGTIIWVPSHE